MKVDCKEPICCRASSGKAGPNETQSGLFGFLGKCDLPYITTKSFVDHAAELKDISFVLYLGDSPAHNVWEHKKEEHLVGFKNFTTTLRKLNLPVYSVLGNHEGYPGDQFDASGKEHEWVIESAIDAWKGWLTEDMEKTFRQNGCYTVNVKGTDLRLITITPFTAMTTNKYLWGNQTDPLGVVSFNSCQ